MKKTAMLLTCLMGLLSTNIVAEQAPIGKIVYYRTQNGVYHKEVFVEEMELETGDIISKAIPIIKTDKEKNILKLTSGNYTGVDFAQLPVYWESAKTIVPLKAIPNLQISISNTSVFYFKMSEPLDLVSFAVNNCGLIQLPESICECTNLKLFSIFNTPLQKLPEHIGNLYNLEHILIDNTDLELVPESMSNLHNVTTFMISSSKLSELPYIGELKKITTLYLNNNQLTSLPEGIGLLTELANLNFSNNQITELPQELDNLQNLYEFNANNNAFTDEEYAKNFIDKISQKRKPIKFEQAKLVKKK